MQKIETIEGLNKEKLVALFLSLLDKMSFQNIRADETCLRAEEKSALSLIKHTFIFPDSKLSGNVNIDAIVKLVKKVREKESFNVLTIVSNHHISVGFQTTFNKELSELSINYMSRDDITVLVDEKFPDYWRHNDLALVEYERQYEEVLERENQLKLLHLPSDKFRRIINTYIQPSLLEEEEDGRTHMLMRKRVDVRDLMLSKKSAVISGQPGAGKSTMLYNIGINLSKENNTMREGRKHLPVFITAMDLINYQKDIRDVLRAKTSSLGNTVDELTNKYEVVLLVDSIDEFESKQQEKIIHQLISLSKKEVRFILTTRNEERYQEYIERKDARFFEILRFNSVQIRRLVNALLPDNQKANDLLDSLRENKILERLPITPLTLSLITILYDETDYEIPATVTDIYTKFNDLVVGRAIVSNKIEYIDVTFRERILSLYGYLLMNREDHQPLTYDEFIDYFVSVYEGKSKHIKGATLEEGLDYIVKNTGILYINNGKYVCFAHDTYMEYYAAVEFFNFHRLDEHYLVDNFFDITWQNVAVFYAGMTKDMDDFAKSINAKLKRAKRVTEFISGIQGAGYLLQALYLSNDVVRRDIILTSLNLSLDTNEAFKKMATLPNTLFKNFRIPIVQLLSLIHFYEMFNSLTLKTPLEMSYRELKTQYEHLVAKSNYDPALLSALGYQLVCLAFTLDSKRIGNNEPLSYLIGQRQLLMDSNINTLINISMEVLGKTKYKELRDTVKKDYYALSDVNRQLISDSSSKIRFSALDTIHPFRKVKLFVEGRSDALILEHAYVTLTHGDFPYWNVQMATQNGKTGSTHAVTKAIDAGVNYSKDYDYIIGIFDHDSAGLESYRKLNKDYDELEVDCIKRNKIRSNVFLLCLPIPGEMKQYLQKKQEFHFFEIEHYLGHEYLKEKKMLKDEVLPNVYELSETKKISFATELQNETNPSIFKFFIDLFKKIDQITGMEINYDASDEHLA